VTGAQSNKSTTTSTRQLPSRNPSTVTEIEKLKESEAMALKRVEEAKKKAKMEIANSEKKIKKVRSQELAKLKQRVSELEVRAEKEAKIEAEGIKEKGIKDAEETKTKVSPRIPNAVNFIVKRIVGGD
jgi:vacuolar-type H+-ATPase subunit H